VFFLVFVKCPFNRLGGAELVCDEEALIKELIDDWGAMVDDLV
jgi:hypothetical protein